MWDCGQCGVRAIAASLHRCPKCRKERNMPKTTVGGGGTNAWEPPGHAAAPKSPSVAEAPEPAAPHAAPATAVPEPEKAPRRPKPAAPGRPGR
jgi:hypothetical protein